MQVNDRQKNNRQENDGQKERAVFCSARSSDPRGSAEPDDCCRRSQEAWRARLSLDDPGHQALPPGLRSAAENRDVRPGPVRSNVGAVPGLGSQSVVVDVRIPRGITHINRGGPSLRTLEEAADDELSHIKEHRLDFKKENKMTTKGKVLVLVSSGHGLPLKDGKVYKGAGYYLNELTVPVRALTKEGYEITFANPKGNTPQLDEI